MSDNKKPSLGKTLLVFGLGALLGYALASGSEDKKIKQGAGKPDNRHE